MKARWPVRLLADDLTGALDSAAAFGAGVPVHLDHPPAGDAAPVSVVATATRDVGPAALPAALDASVRWLGEAGLAFKKVDSLLRGNALAEVRWLAAAGGFERVVFAPAFPAQGRYLLQERLVVVAPGEAADPAARRGEPLRGALTDAGWPGRCELLLPDVRGDADLDRLCRDAAGSGARTLWCGSAGLAAALARQLVVPAAAPAATAPAAGPVWVLGASHQAVTRRQWARVMAAHPQAPSVRHGDAQAFEQALSAQARAEAPLALLDLSPLTPLDAGAAAALLRSQVTRLAALPQPPARLLVLGGDTARALAGATGVDHLVSGQPLRPGWGQARWCGGRWDGLWMDCRSGAFGDDDDLLAAVAAAREPHRAREARQA
ncbi:uncharacterized protein YgbK (DUF1537 family) [Sphaerotilus hippei]|uniref:Uncharacterized protein YgbK (DUF1537 family) n=1 Tax=Sphaerotilus hippei TaxID=744406 RepID=A0A318H604_9BURK|nr:four-carbon acid sugar kinase family protein [Sphaerotilus hippei]PXW99345.1 uncharacterized protein YgbK (DUF1537 family) [Sphaerotilus hippei]